MGNNSIATLVLGIIGGLVLILSVPYAFFVLSLMYHVPISAIMSIPIIMAFALIDIILGILIMIFGIIDGVKPNKPLSIVMMVVGGIGAIASYILLGGFVGMIGGALGIVGGSLGLRSEGYHSASSRGWARQSDVRAIYNKIDSELSHTGSYTPYNKQDTVACPQCGYLNSKTENFCGKCGTALTKVGRQLADLNEKMKQLKKDVVDSP